MRRFANSLLEVSVVATPITGMFLMNDSIVTQQLNSLVALAKKMGFEIRHEFLGGTGAGICQVKGKYCLFLDLASTPADQLDAIRQSLDDAGL